MSAAEENYNSLSVIGELLLLAIDGKISTEQFDSLQDQLRNNPEAQDYYYEFLTTYVAFSSCEGSAIPTLTETNDPSDYDALLSQMAENEKIAPVIKIEKQQDSKTSELTKVTKPKKEPYKIDKFFLYTGFISAAALFLILAYVIMNPRDITKAVATLTETVNAQWQADTLAIKGDQIWNHTGPQRLLKGAVTIDFDYGAQVVIEGPAQVEFINADTISLSYGRVFAHVPEYATGFTIETPYSRVIDLGTQFGIKVDVDGATDVHMFKGKASLIPGMKGQSGPSQMLTVGQARHVTTSGYVNNIPIQENVFARRISSQSSMIWRGQTVLDLADIVRGGNGLGTGTENRTIQLDTGKLIPQRMIGDQRKLGPPGLIRADSLPFVDCLFVPDGDQGSIAVNTQGDMFEGCPDTDGYSWGDILGGGIMFHDQRPGRQLEMSLNGTTYGTPERPGIFMHGNLGITFDLGAIRSSMPGFDITRFTSLCGISETVLIDPTFIADPEIFPLTDIWVLVDGQVRFGSEKMKVASQPQTIDIGLSTQDRFLTLVITDGGDSNSFDWGIFAEPFLHIEP